MWCSGPSRRKPKTERPANSHNRYRRAGRPLGAVRRDRARGGRAVAVVPLAEGEPDSRGERCLRRQLRLLAPGLCGSGLSVGVGRPGEGARGMRRSSDEAHHAALAAQRRSEGRSEALSLVGIASTGWRNSPAAACPNGGTASTSNRPSRSPAIGCGPTESDGRRAASRAGWSP
ncbi:hypothetical protein ACFY3J_31155 [Streptomyces sp. NPDC001231]|uniref:hypothetical protein n=1 Tax=Streptomyces sp. NPDC001231 TaxID=3364549 RepID=UPI0036A578A9